MVFNLTATATSQAITSVGQLRGLTAIGCAGLVSTLSSLVLLLCFVYSIYVDWGRPTNSVSGLQRFLRSSLGYYLCSTFFADLILGLGFVISFHWVAEKRIYDSPSCQFQAGSLQFADFLTGLSTLGLTLHTFAVLVPLRTPSRKVALIAVPLMWVLSFVTASIGPTVVQRGGDRFYGIAGQWCYISNHYPNWRFILLYDLIWTVMLVSFVCYFWIFLVLSGTIRTRIKYTQSPVSSGDSPTTLSPNQLSHQTSLKMLSYPIAYLLVFLPLSVIRLMTLCNPKQKVPLSLVIFAGLCSASTGTINCLLFVCTRWSLLSTMGTRESTWSSSSATDSSKATPGSDNIDFPSLSRVPAGGDVDISSPGGSASSAAERLSREDPSAEKDEEADGKLLDFFSALDRA